MSVSTTMNTSMTMSDLQKLMVSLPNPLPLGPAYMRPEAYELFVETCEAKPPTIGTATMGMDVVKSKWLPKTTKTGRIISRDPFATYDREDMEWAEPAGLASWEEVPLAGVQIPHMSPFMVEMRPPEFSDVPMGMNMRMWT